MTAHSCCFQTAACTLQVLLRSDVCTTTWILWDIPIYQSSLVTYNLHKIPHHCTINKETSVFWFVQDAQVLHGDIAQEQREITLKVFFVTYQLFFSYLLVVATYPPCPPSPLITGMLYSYVREAVKNVLKTWSLLLKVCHALKNVHIQTSANSESHYNVLIHVIFMIVCCILLMGSLHSFILLYC